MIKLRFNSHRARRKLEDFLGRKPRFFWTWEHGGIFAEVTDDEYARLRSAGGITGVTKPRQTLDFQECITY